MRRLILLAGIAALALATSAGATSLNKCIDAQGEVTYSNLPCRNTQQARTVEIDPAPPQSGPAPSTPDPVPAKAGPQPTASAPAPATIQLETRRTSGKPVTRSLTRQCDTISDKLGRVFDKMDQARRKGYTQAQMDAWNQEVKDLERKKQQSGCF
jgi:hypothetical protein